MSESGRRRILVVEDESDAAATLSEFLLRQGYAVVVAENGDAALAAIGEASFDLVLTDLRMPGLDGMPFLRSLREALPTTPVIVMTGHGAMSETQPGEGLSGIAAVLWKPLSLREISLKLHDLLG